VALSDGLLGTIRSWVGTAVPPTDSELEASYDLWGSAKTVVEKILRQRRADWLASPASFSGLGILTTNATTNIEAIERDLAQLALMTDDLGWDDSTGEVVPTGLVTSYPMRRAGYRR
jgi:hypothetical protein